MFSRALNKPHYVFRPKQVLTRLRSGRFDAAVPREIVVELPWGLPLGALTTDAVGHVLERTGVFDPAVSEALLRLTDPGEFVVDVGANVGYMTSLFVVGVGDSGRVLCFEPQPDLRATLEENVRRWRGAGIKVAIEVRREALSSRSGIGHMSSPGSGQSRDGGSVGEPDSGDSEGSYDVPLARLDELLVPPATIGVLKIDVERHELEVMRGSEDLLKRGAIRDIVFEEHDAYPTQVTKLLEAHGYRVFKLDHSLVGPWIGPPSSRRQTMTDPSFLATLAPERALTRMRRRGWSMFPVSRFSRTPTA